jgi:hypothetical protein
MKTMKVLFNATIFFLLLTVFAVSSCSKYDEGSNFTFLSKTSRLVNTWKFKLWTANSEDITAQNTISEVNIKKDNTIQVTYLLFGFNLVDNGTWAFNDDKTQFIWTKSTNEITIYTILKLTKDELKLETSDSQAIYKITLVTK